MPIGVVNGTRVHPFIYIRLFDPRGKFQALANETSHVGSGLAEMRSAVWHAWSQASQ